MLAHRASRPRRTQAQLRLLHPGHVVQPQGAAEGASGERVLLYRMLETAWGRRSGQGGGSGSSRAAGVESFKQPGRRVRPGARSPLTWSTSSPSSCESIDGPEGSRCWTSSRACVEEFTTSAGRPPGSGSVAGATGSSARCARRWRAPPSCARARPGDPRRVPALQGPDVRRGRGRRAGPRAVRPRRRAAAAAQRHALQDVHPAGRARGRGPLRRLRRHGPFLAGDERAAVKRDSRRLRPGLYAGDRRRARRSRSRPDGAAPGDGAHGAARRHPRPRRHASSSATCPESARARRRPRLPPSAGSQGRSRPRTRWSTGARRRTCWSSWRATRSSRSSQRPRRRRTRRSSSALAGGAAAARWDDVRLPARSTPATPRCADWSTDVLDRGAWQLAWIPPSLPYYELGGPYAEPELQEFTKRLVFSAWAVAPKAIGTVMSYEAERRIAERGRTARSARLDQYDGTGRPGLLTFNAADGRLTGHAGARAALPLRGAGPGRRPA